MCFVLKVDLQVWLFGFVQYVVYIGDVGVVSDWWFVQGECFVLLLCLFVFVVCIDCVQVYIYICVWCMIFVCQCIGCGIWYVFGQYQCCVQQEWKCVFYFSFCSLNVISICSSLYSRLLMLIYSVVIVMFVYGLVVNSSFSIIVSMLLRISSYLFWICLCMWIVNMMWQMLVISSYVVRNSISMLVVVSGLIIVRMLKFSEVMVYSVSQLCGVLLLLLISVNRLMIFLMMVIMFSVYVSVIVVDNGQLMVMMLKFSVIRLYSSRIYQLWLIVDNKGDRGEFMVIFLVQYWLYFSFW